MKAEKKELFKALAAMHLCDFSYEPMAIYGEMVTGSNGSPFGHVGRVSETEVQRSNLLEFCLH